MGAKSNFHLQSSGIATVEYQKFCSNILMVAISAIGFDEIGPTKEKSYKKNLP